MSKDIEQKLRKAIVRSRMSRYRISKLSGVSEGQLSLFVNGKRSLTLPAAAKLAKVLGLELTEKKAR
jgi:plasmid maintenance system antidote protein VapI